MIAIEYTDMISRMITTVIATAPIFLTISVIVNSLPVVPPGVGLGVCKRNRRKPIAFVPRMVVRIVTVTPPKVFDYIDCLTGSCTERAALGLVAGDQRADIYLLRYKVVDDYAVHLHRLPRELGRGELRRPRRTDGRCLQQWMTRSCVGRDYVPVLIS